jgi:dTDP-4-amino-4,6-dideoxygalactose transaminase
MKVFGMRKSDTIEFNRLDLQFKKYKKELNKAALNVLKSGNYILGPELNKFESQMATYLNSKYCIGVNSGTDALILELRALGIGEGDEVIVPANTYIATVIAVTENKATPVFVEPNEYFLVDPKLIEKAITSKTKAIIPVHLYGQACDMDAIMNIAKKHQLYVVEDCAQSHGATYKDQMTGTFGDIGCFSFYPTKNLGAIGDGGAIVTNDKEIDRKLRMMRNFGSEKKYHHEIEGINSRLDEIQAAMLSVKLKHLDEMNKERQKIASYYLSKIKNPIIELPRTAPHNNHVYHLFVIKTPKRDELIKYLEKHNIKTQIHYPIPPHLEARYHNLKYNEGTYPITEEGSKSILSLPLYSGIKASNLLKIVNVLEGFK